jgi:hypothetical protein
MFFAHFASRRTFLTLASLAVMGLAMAAAPRHANAQAITDLYNTGVDASKNLLLDGEIDPHYTQNSGNLDTPNTFVYTNGAYVDNPTSKYIAIDQTGGGGGYTVNFRTSFTLPSNVDLSAVSIAGNWSTDDLGNDILINGVSTGITSSGFSTFTNFVLPTGSFVVGTNTLEFVLENQGGPGALNVYFDSATLSAGGTATPEPGSVAFLAGMGLSGATFLRRRRSSSKAA